MIFHFSLIREMLQPQDSLLYYKVSTYLFREPIIFIFIHTN